MDFQNNVKYNVDIMQILVQGVLWNAGLNFIGTHIESATNKFFFESLFSLNSC